jgi:hypothetical protein
MHFAGSHVRELECPGRIASDPSLHPYMLSRVRFTEIFDRQSAQGADEPGFSARHGGQLARVVDVVDVARLVDVLEAVLVTWSHDPVAVPRFAAFGFRPNDAVRDGRIEHCGSKLGFERSGPVWTEMDDGDPGTYGFDIVSRLSDCVPEVVAGVSNASQPRLDLDLILEVQWREEFESGRSRNSAHDLVAEHEAIEAECRPSRGFEHSRDPAWRNAGRRIGLDAAHRVKNLDGFAYRFGHRRRAP